MLGQSLKRIVKKEAASFLFFCFCLYASAAFASPAPPEQDAAAIRAAIQAAAAARLDAFKDASLAIDVGEIDPRLHLPACPALAVTLPPMNAATMTAKVACDEPAWTIYVPVRVQAWVDAVVAAGNLAPNTNLTAANLAIGRVDLFAGAGAVVTDRNAAEGKILRTGLSAGTPLRTQLLDLPIAVHRGQKVVLMLEDSIMTIKAIAVALEDGRVGQSIMLQNPESKKTIRATVAGDGTAEMKF
ncbi:MAG TPA: flagellar basal body P-ring formation chaperone FlgA [Stellaceae bacterium]|nr:flagellar basal body P-ring formation chaperone FlgA [Stellaceae bacterium]